MCVWLIKSLACTSLKKCSSAVVFLFWRTSVNGCFWGNVKRKFSIESSTPPRCYFSLEVFLKMCLIKAHLRLSQKSLDKNEFFEICLDCNCSLCPSLYILPFLGINRFCCIKFDQHFVLIWKLSEKVQNVFLKISSDIRKIFVFNRIFWYKSILLKG